MVRCINLMNRVRKLQLLAGTPFAYDGGLDQIVGLIIAWTAIQARPALARKSRRPYASTRCVSSQGLN
jgi:hypothetical protein